MDTEGYVRVFLPEGVRAHLVPETQAHKDAHPARCGLTPRTLPAKYWRGVATTAEYDHAHLLELCARCVETL